MAQTVTIGLSKLEYALVLGDPDVVTFTEIPNCLEGTVTFAQDAPDETEIKSEQSDSPLAVIYEANSLDFEADIPDPTPELMEDLAGATLDTTTTVGKTYVFPAAGAPVINAMIRITPKSGIEEIIMFDAQITMHASGNMSKTESSNQHLIAKALVPDVARAAYTSSGSPARYKFDTP